MRDRLIVGLAGYKGSGKSTAARYMTVAHNFQIVRFASEILDMAKAFGLSDRQVSGDLKDTPTPQLCGKTPRFFLNQLGIHFGREFFGEDLWVQNWRHRMDETLRVTTHNIVVDNVRFANEADAVRKYGGIIIRVVSDKAIPTGAVQHVSELLRFPVDGLVLNNGKLGQLYDALDKLLGQASTRRCV